MFDLWKERQQMSKNIAAMTVLPHIIGHPKIIST